MLILAPGLSTVMISCALTGRPYEVCGVLAGASGTDTVVRMIELVNADPRPALRYRFDPREQARVWKRLQAAGQAPIGVWHSHTKSGAYPSETDVAAGRAAGSGVHWVIVAVTDPRRPILRSYRFSPAGQVIPEPVVDLDGDDRSVPLAAAPENHPPSSTPTADLGR